MFSYSFGFKLVGRMAQGRVDSSSANNHVSIYCPGDSDSQSDTILFAADGYESEDAATLSMWSQFLNCKLG